MALVPLLDKDGFPLICGEGEEDVPRSGEEDSIERCCPGFTCSRPIISPTGKKIIFHYLHTCIRGYRDHLPGDIDPTLGGAGVHLIQGTSRGKIELGFYSEALEQYQLENLSPNEVYGPLGFVRYTWVQPSITNTYIPTPKFVHTPATYFIDTWEDGSQHVRQGHDGRAVIKTPEKWEIVDDDLSGYSRYFLPKFDVTGGQVVVNRPFYKSFTSEEAKELHPNFGRIPDGLGGFYPEEWYDSGEVFQRYGPTLTPLDGPDAIPWYGDYGIPTDIDLHVMKTYGITQGELDILDQEGMNPHSSTAMATNAADIPFTDVKFGGHPYKNVFGFDPWKYDVGGFEGPQGSNRDGEKRFAVENGNYSLHPYKQLPVTGYYQPAGPLFPSAPLFFGEEYMPFLSMPASVAISVSGNLFSGVYNAYSNSSIPPHITHGFETTCAGGNYPSGGPGFVDGIQLNIDGIIATRNPYTYIRTAQNLNPSPGEVWWPKVPPPENPTSERDLYHTANREWVREESQATAFLNSLNVSGMELKAVRHSGWTAGFMGYQGAHISAFVQMSLELSSPYSFADQTSYAHFLAGTGPYAGKGAGNPEDWPLEFYYRSKIKVTISPGTYSNLQGNQNGASVPFTFIYELKFHPQFPTQRWIKGSEYPDIFMKLKVIEDATPLGMFEPDDWNWLADSIKTLYPNAYTQREMHDTIPNLNILQQAASASEIGLILNNPFPIIMGEPTQFQHNTGINGQGLYIFHIDQVPNFLYAPNKQWSSHGATSSTAGTALINFP